MVSPSKKFIYLICLGSQPQKQFNQTVCLYDSTILSFFKGFSNYFTTISFGDGGSYAVEDWVPGIQFKIVDTKANENRLEWNAKDLGVIQLPDACMCEEG